MAPKKEVKNMDSRESLGDRLIRRQREMQNAALVNIELASFITEIIGELTMAQKEKIIQMVIDQANEFKKEKEED